MSDRDRVINAVLGNTPWADWQRQPVAGDASARRYFRLKSGDQSVIVMDAPPETCSDTAQFIDVAETLCDAGLSAPQVLHSDLQRGVLVLSDLGTADFASHLRRHPKAEFTLYAAATDLLADVSKIRIDSNLTHLTPDYGAEMVGVLTPFYTDQEVSQLQQEIRRALDTFAPTPDTLALRDFHAENLIWRPDRHGRDQVGLLDFQDAIIAPTGYDLASLITDARRDVSPEVATAMITRHAKALGHDEDQLRLQIQVLGVQRNLRILGIFAKLARNGKPRYLQFMQRVWHHIQCAFAAPELAALRDTVSATLPAPTPEHLRGLQG